MILVFAYWCLVFLITSTLGIAISQLLKLKTNDPLEISLLGGFGITVLASTVAIWGNLGFYFEGGLLLLGLCCLIIYRQTFKKFIFSLKAKISELPTALKIIGIVITFIAVAQSASAPYMIDNETYYIQTIKWLDAYGFVPGLANLHFFLSQMSGFHILQAAVNLDGLYPHYNDLSGFYLLLGNYYALFHLRAFFKDGTHIDLVIGLFPLFNVFLFQFIGAPSPDILVYVIFLVLTSRFIATYKTPTRNDIVFLFLLSIFAIYIKLTAILCIAFPVVLLLRKEPRKKDWIHLVPIGVLVFVLFLVKNTITTGYPLYPIVGTGALLPEIALPENLQTFYTESTKLHGYFMDAQTYDNATLLELFKRWITLPKLHGLFNIGICIVLVLFPFVVRKSFARRPGYIIYGLTIVQMVLLWVSSPQYRYFFMFFMILTTIIIASLIRKRTIVLLGVTIATLIAAIPLFIPLNLNNFTENQFHLSLSTFSTAYIVHPHKKTKYPSAQYESFTIGKDSLITPTNIDFFWATGDGALPCVQRDQVLYFAQEFNFIPQLRSQNLKDGFYSKDLTND